MIQSMTGYGAAQHVDAGACYSLEIRSLNNRYLKLSIKLPEQLQYLESDVDRLLRTKLHRGSVTYALRIRSEGNSGARPLNLAALQAYVNQLARVDVPAGVTSTIELASLTTLPGVCDSPDLDERAREHQQGIVTALTHKVIDALIEMRGREGRALGTDLNGCCEQMRSLVSEVARRSPVVVEEYHQRLQTRVSQLMQAGGFELAAEGLMREVAIYADRCDISEEIARFASHLDQFNELCERGDRVGRTLDFLTQELLREANTVASKSNDQTIARNIVELKGLIDRLKEQVQNVE